MFLIPRIIPSARLSRREEMPSRCNISWEISISMLGCFDRKQAYLDASSRELHRNAICKSFAPCLDTPRQKCQVSDVALEPFRHEYSLSRQHVSSCVLNVCKLCLVPGVLCAYTHTHTYMCIYIYTHLFRDRDAQNSTIKFVRGL